MKLFNNIYAKLFFIFSGVIATCWFLIRVIPKPSRANYPCMQAAAPIMSSFVIYLISISCGLLFFKKATKKLYEYRFLSAFSLFSVSALFYFIFAFNNAQPALAKTNSYLASNTPVGIAKGTNPGRVTWYYDNAATNENLIVSQNSNLYYLPSNTNEAVVQKMVDKSIQNLASSNNTTQAWDSIFTYFNRNHDKGNVSYINGEKIFIKVNIVGQWNINSNFDITTGNFNAGHTTPQIINAVLKQLIEDKSIPQSNISVGDPIQPMPKEYFNYLSAKYPSVNYICNRGGSGHTKAIKGNSPTVFYSDRGKILRSGDPKTWVNSQTGDVVEFDTLYKVIEDADYMINIANLKGHERAGVSLCAKNHFGSHTRYQAKQLHMGLIHPNQSPDAYSRDTYREYRVLVDLMGHKKLGGNTMLFMVDGLYSATGSGDKVVKWKSSGFNNDWTSSIFASQDGVAIESVCLDFLKEEYRTPYSNKTTPQYNAIDDYLLQAADSSYWPADIKYDPENDGTTIKSLGVFETWNNAAEKKYSRNLGTGNGIELIAVHQLPTGISNQSNSSDVISKIYPNPVTHNSVISINCKTKSIVTINLYAMNGQLVNSICKTISTNTEIPFAQLVKQPSNILSRQYICTITMVTDGITIKNSHKVTL